jgi:hypothetical protein
VHLISDSCHQEDDCSHPDHEQGCADEGCSSESCSDELALGDCLPHDSIHLQLFTQVALVGQDELFSLQTKPHHSSLHRVALRPPSHRMTVLRL